MYDNVAASGLREFLRNSLQVEENLNVVFMPVKKKVKNANNNAYLQFYEPNF